MTLDVTVERGAPHTNHVGMGSMWCLLPVYPHLPVAGAFRGSAGIGQKLVGPPVLGCRRRGLALLRLLAVRVVSMAIIIKIAASGDGLTICGSPHIIPSGPLYQPTGRGGMTPLDADLPRKGPKV